MSAVRLSTAPVDRKSTRLNSSHLVISYAVFCLKKTATACPAYIPSRPVRFLILRRVRQSGRSGAQDEGERQTCARKEPSNVVVLHFFFEAGRPPEPLPPLHHAPVPE